MAKPVRVVVAALALLVAGVLSACAQEAPPTLRVGVVDLELVGRNFARKIQEEEALTQWYIGEQRMLRALDGYIFCVAEEWEKALTLLRAPTAQRTPEQEDQLKALSAEGTKREMRYKELEAKQAQGAITKDEENELKVLRDIATTRSTDRNARIEALEGELERRMGSIREELMKPVRETVNAVAAEKGLTLILEKDYVYFGGEDVTEDVVKKLNATAPPGAAAPAAGGDKPKEGEGGKPAEGGNP